MSYLPFPECYSSDWLFYDGLCLLNLRQNNARKLDFNECKAALGTYLMQMGLGRDVQLGSDFVDSCKLSHSSSL